MLDKRRTDRGNNAPVFCLQCAKSREQEPRSQQQLFQILKYFPSRLFPQQLQALSKEDLGGIPGGPLPRTFSYLMDNSQALIVVCLCHNQLEHCLLAFLFLFILGNVPPMHCAVQVEYSLTWHSLSTDGLRRPTGAAGGGKLRLASGE